MKLALAATVVLLALAPAAAAGGNSIVANPQSPTATSGVSFTVTIQGGNRDYASVAVNCTSGGSVVYSTVLNVLVDATGTGTSQLIYPPASSCTADLEKQMSIGRARVLASISFTVAP